MARIPLGPPIDDGYAPDCIKIFRRMTTVEQHLKPCPLKKNKHQYNNRNR